MFGDPTLDALENEVTTANQTLKAAEARFAQARALVGVARAGLVPTLGAGRRVISCTSGCVRRIRWPRFA
jgi:outer membrane protein TolC